jgi:hypothetical protein
MNNPTSDQLEYLQCLLDGLKSNNTEQWKLSAARSLEHVAQEIIWGFTGPPFMPSGDIPPNDKAANSSLTRYGSGRM